MVVGCVMISGLLCICLLFVGGLGLILVLVVVIWWFGVMFECLVCVVMD